MFEGRAESLPPVQKDLAVYFARELTRLGVSTREALAAMVSLL